MNKVVNEWIDKAEEDFHAAISLRRLRRYPTHNAVCFHAQQCIEKYLKAIAGETWWYHPKDSCLTHFAGSMCRISPFIEFFAVRYGEVVCLCSRIPLSWRISHC